MAEPSLHPALEPIAFLLGTWRGSGKGHYPNIDDFVYDEEVRFWHVGRPFLAYWQQTWAPDTGQPMHGEMGYWRPQRDGSIEVVIAHGFGVVEVDEGTISGKHIELQSKSLSSTSTAKTIDAIGRAFTLGDGTLTYEVSMAYGGVPLQPHLAAELHPQDAR